MLSSKSLTDLRGLAQSLGVKDIFQLDRAHLMQAIEARQAAMLPKPAEPLVKPEYDARLMTKRPAKRGDQQEVERLLQPYIERGLHLSFPEPEIWAMRCGKKTDTGTMRMPMRIILRCAEKMLEP